MSLLIFDWGGTLMVEYPEYTGTMVDWPVVTAVEGLAEALPILAKTHTLVVGSNAEMSNGEQIHAALHRVGLGQYFTRCFTPVELKARKPSPGFCRGIAQIMGYPLSDAMMIGDSYAYDVLGATQAGLRGVWFNPLCQPCPGLLPQHDVEIHRMADLPAALGRLRLPDLAECLVWYQRAEISTDLWLHVNGVASAAYLLALRLRTNGYSVDPILTHRGGLLHDLGKLAARHPSAPTNNHGELGAMLLEQYQQPALAEIARRHLMFYLENIITAPHTWEEKLVHFTDKLIEGSAVASLDERLHALTQRYPREAPRMLNMRPTLLTMQAEICTAANIPEDQFIQYLRSALHG